MSLKILRITFVILMHALIKLSSTCEHLLKYEVQLSCSGLKITLYIKEKTYLFIFHTNIYYGLKLKICLHWSVYLLVKLLAISRARKF